MTDQRLTHDEAIDLAAGYVLGALQPAEEAAVREHLATCRLPHPELEELGGVVPALQELGVTELVEPPAALRDRILAAAAADRTERTRAAASEPAGAVAVGAAVPASLAPATPAAPEPIPFPSEDERTVQAERTRSGTSRLDWAIRIAAVVAIVALGAWGYNNQQDLKASQAFNQAVGDVLAAAAQPGAQIVVLAPQQGQQGSGLAAVLPDGSVQLAMHDLPANAGTEVYTAWVIVGDQAPTSVGDFSVGSTGIQLFTSKPAPTPEGATIAITREPQPGNTAPEGPVVSAGIATVPGATG
jgi:anti-sigma-K factor RskA